LTNRSQKNDFPVVAAAAAAAAVAVAVAVSCLLPAAVLFSRGLVHSLVIYKQQPFCHNISRNA